MTDLERLCERDGVTADFRFGEAKTKGFGDNNWRVTLGRKGKKLSVDFFGTKPSVADVLYCLCSDVLLHENDEYDDLGLTAKEAIHAYKKLVKLVPQVRDFLGDDFEEYARAAH